jgi:hypothetical protein
VEFVASLQNGWAGTRKAGFGTPLDLREETRSIGVTYCCEVGIVVEYSSKDLELKSMKKPQQS